MSILDRLKGKRKLSRDVFAKRLLLSLDCRLDQETIAEDADDFGYQLVNEQNEFDIGRCSHFQRVMFDFYMWLIILTCSRMLGDDPDRQNECLDKFHYFVYQEYFHHEDF